MVIYIVSLLQLTQLEGLHPLPRLVLEYRQVLLFYVYGFVHIMSPRLDFIYSGIFDCTQLCKINATYITGILPYIAKVRILQSKYMPPHPALTHTHRALLKPHGESVSQPQVRQSKCGV